MLRAGKYLTLTTLISVLFVALPAKAGNDQGSQLSLSLDAQGESLIPFDDPLLPNKPSDTGIGAAAFLDWRPVRLISFGVGTEYFYYPSSPSFKVSSFDLGGRIFPFSTVEGEVYFQGGVGRNIVLEYPTPGHYHGYAGIGYRKYLSGDTALDMGIQYDFFSPILTPSNGLGAKVGITFLFGRDSWPVPNANIGAENFNSTGEYPAGSYYVWKPGDTLKSIAVRVLGAEGLYPALVDANRDLFSDTANLRVGMKLRVPDANFSDDELDDIRAKAISASYVRLEEYSSRLPYEGQKNWKGARTYVWKEGDDLKSVASKLYDDEDLYPVLVDANKKRLIHPINLVPGVVLVVPAPPADIWVDSIHERAQQKDYYIWWKTVSESSGEDQ
jgi:hypothetical protein